MKRIIYTVCFVLMIAGCGFEQRPAWIIDGSKRLETFQKDFLTGAESSVTEYNFRKALDEIKKSGDLDLLQRAWLTRMAVQCAALEEMEEEDYLKIAKVYRVPENENYYLFLKGDIVALDIRVLPEQYRGFLSALSKGDLLKTGEEIASMKDVPLSQLIAAAIAARSNFESEAILQAAVERASQNGWKRALTAWLGRLAGYYESAGEAGKASDVRRRIELIEK